MPFSGKVNSYYESLYKKVIQESGMTSLRVDELYGPKPIISDITEGIAKADIVLADLTNRNPNVNYELGIAHTLGKPTILIAQSKADISFDYQHIRIYFYDTSDINWQNDLSKYISNSINVIKNNPTGFSLFDYALVEKKSEQKKSNQNITSYLSSIYKQQKAEINYEYEFYIDESGNALIETVFHVRTNKEFSLLKYKIFNAIPGNIEIKSVVEIGNNKSVNYFISEKGDYFKGIYMLLDTKPKNYSFRVKLIVFAENYITDLILKNKSISYHHTDNRQDKEIQYNDRLVKYYFPSTDKFEKIDAKATIMYDDGTSETKKLLKKKVRNRYLFEMQNTDKIIPEFNIEFNI